MHAEFFGTFHPFEPRRDIRSLQPAQRQGSLTLLDPDFLLAASLQPRLVEFAHSLFSLQALFTVDPKRYPNNFAAAAPAALSRLENFDLEFRDPADLIDRRIERPTPKVLPVLQMVAAAKQFAQLRGLDSPIGFGRGAVGIALQDFVKNQSVF